MIASYKKATIMPGRLLLFATSALLLATPCLASPHVTDIENAFKAAFPTTSLVATLPANSPGCNCRFDKPIQVRLTAQAAKLISLGDDHFALIALETNEDAYHAQPGAVSIAYLEREGNDWHVMHVWRELAWTGNSGFAADKIWTSSYGENRLLFLSSDFVGQGQHSIVDAAITLRSNAPVLNGHFPAGGFIDEISCLASKCGGYAYTASVHPPARKADLFSVSYRGWTSLSGRRSDAARLQHARILKRRPPG